MHSWTSAGLSIWPCSARYFANHRWPVSKASISGFTPSACICFAISTSIAVLLVMM